MNFKNNEIKSFPNESDILSLLSEEDIFQYYIGSLPTLIKSPLRNDNIPSFGLFLSKKYNRIMYKDLATGDVGDCFIFVKKLFGYSRITDSFNKIAFDFNLDQFKFVGDIKNNDVKALKNIANAKKITSKETITIRVKVREWNKEDYNYWKIKYDINLKLLKNSMVFPISHYFINNYLVKVKGLAYAFVENKDGIQTYKIYQPFEETKWINNNNYSVWELWEQLPKEGENLIISSSRKDSIVIKSMFENKFITSCSLQGENFRPKRIVMEELSKRFKNKFILYDNDKYKEKNWGKIAASKICKEYSDLGFKQIEIPDIYEEKDISDFKEIHKKEKSKNLILSLIKC